MHGRGRRAFHGGRPNVGELPLAEDVRREIDSHIDMRTEELVAEGWEPAAARAEAIRLFGNVREVRKMMERETRSRDRAVRRERLLEGVWQDLRFAARTLARAPGFAATALITLALGIGANTAIFSVVNGVLLRPLPYAEPDELVYVLEWKPNIPGGMAVAWPNYVDWSREARSFEALSAYTSFTGTVLGAERPLRVPGAGVSDGFWGVFPVAPVAGRLTGPADHDLGAPPVIVVREDFWRDELGGRPLETLTLQAAGMEVQVVGVAPAHFDYPGGARFWFPTELAQWGDSRSAHNLTVVGRLADGIDVARADEELDRLTVAMLADSGEDREYLADGALVVPLRERLVGSARSPLTLLFAAAGLVLLAACTNLASTLLARGTTRVRELSIRSSLGAARGRIVRQLMTENVLLSLAGAAAGVLLALLALPLLRAYGGGSVPRLDEVGIDTAVLGFTVLVAALTALVFGLVPAVQVASRDVGSGLREGDRGSAASLRGGMWRLLVGTEVALALVLLIGSVLTVRSVRNIVGEDRGFDPSDVVMTRVSLNPLSYPDQMDHARWFRNTLEELEQTPGVERAGLISAPPLSFIPNGRIELDGDVEKRADAHYLLASGGYFEAMDIPVVEGRVFDEADTRDSPHVAVVSRSFVDRYWPGETAVGRSVTGGGMDDFYASARFAQVVGVVEDVQYEAVTEDLYPAVYFPYTQRPFRLRGGGAAIVVESVASDPAALTPVLRDVIGRNDPTVPLQPQTLEARIAGSVTGRRFVMGILGGFAALAFLLAVVGIYGVVSYSAARRTREVGIRLALGATPESVRRMVLTSGLLMAIGGVVVGSLVSYFAVTTLTAQLYEVGPRDPSTFAAAVLALIAAATIAAWLPAHRTTKVDPVVTMKTE